MSAERLRRIWSAGGAAYGAAVRLGSGWAVEVFSKSGLDFVWIDREHGLNDDASLMPMLQAMNGSAAASLVRVRANEAAEIGRVLDAGSDGVIVPMVQNASDAGAAVAATRFGQAGVRSYGSFRLRHLAGGYRRDVLCVAMVESEEGVRNADAIAAEPGVDAIFIGPADLALSLGLEPRGGIQPGVHADAVAAVVSACRRAGIAVGMTGDACGLRQLGFTMISLGADMTFLEQGLRAALAGRDAADLPPDRVPPEQDPGN
jgi:4-hydroxy-2-oxoheptanedioate aldolase